MTLESAIKTAIELEQRICKVYDEAATKASDELGRKVFGQLGKEEQYHVDFLCAKLVEWKETGSATPKKLETIIPTKENIKKEISKIQKTMAKKDFNVEIEMLRKALNLELDSSNFYENLIKKLSKQDGRFFTPFIEVENNHLAFVQAELDSITGEGHWWAFPELDMEIGL
jgi:rubrerythrin